MTQAENSHYPDTIDVVCDHCSSGYHVSIMHFADSFKHQFHCPSCEQTWDEYLDIPVWEELRGPARELRRIEQEKEKQAIEAEIRKVREQQAKEQAAREAEEKARNDAREQAEREAKELAEQEAQEQAEQEIARLEQEAESARLEAEETALAGRTEATNLEPGAKKSKQKPARKSKKNTLPATPKGFIGKILMLVNPVRWGQFSIAPLFFSIMFLTFIYIGSVGYFYVNRDDIVQANPLAAGPYHAVGIPVSPVDGLNVRITDIERKDIKVPGERTQYEFNIRTKVRNFSGAERRLPYLRFSVLNLEGERLEFWDVDLTGRVLQANEEMNVATVIPEEFIGDERVDSFVARLISKAEREYLGIGQEVENIAATS